MKFRFEARGRVRPAGHTVRYPATVGSVTVTFSDTPPTPSVGIPPDPVTRSVRVAPGPRTTPPSPVRVSMSRVGVTASKPRSNHPATSTTRWVEPAEL